MALVTINPTPAIKPLTQTPVNQPQEQDADAFQKVLKQQQLTQREAQKSRDIGAKSPESNALNKSTKAASDIPEKAEQASQTSHQPAKKDTTDSESFHTRLADEFNNAAYNEMQRQIQSSDQAPVLQTTNPLESAIGLVQSNDISGDEAIQNEQLTVETVTTDSALLPMLNMLNLSSVIQAKFNASGVASDASIATKNTTGIDGKYAANTSDVMGDAKTLSTKPLESNDVQVIQQGTEQHQTGFNQKLTEALNESITVRDVHATKASQTQESLSAAVNVAISTPQSVTATNNLQSVTSNMISPQLASPAWNDAISKKIIWMVGAEQQSATLTLNPPDLGPVQVVIQVHNEQADTTFISQNPEVRQALEDGLDNLRSMMTNAGIELGQANVHAEQQSQQQAQASSTGMMRSKSASDASQLPVAKATTRTLTSNGLVDTFA